MRAESIGSNLTTPIAASVRDDSTMLTRQERKQRRRGDRCKSEGVAFMRESLIDTKAAVEPSLAPIDESKQKTKPEPLSEVVVSSKCCISVLNVHTFLTQFHL
jgi:hypothetical protein